MMLMLRCGKVAFGSRSFLHAHTRVTCHVLEQAISVSTSASSAAKYASEPPPLPSPEDATLERRGTGSRKWRHFGDAVPLWVADMDFRCPRPVIEAVKATAEHGIYGYAGPDPGLAAATVGRLRQRYGFDTLVVDNHNDHNHNEERANNNSNMDCSTARRRRRKRQSAGAVSVSEMERMIRWIPGLLPGLNHIVKAAQADPAWHATDAYRSGTPLGVAVATPIYAPFLTAPNNQSATTVEVPLVPRVLEAKQGGGSILHYEIDEDALAAALAREDVRVLLWCNPHNPTGRVWTRDEMRSVAQLCADNDVALLSDEVWAEVILDEDATPFTGAAAMLAEDEVGWRLAKAGLVVLASPSKAFNVAALDLALAVIPDVTARRRFTKAGGDKAEIPPFGFAAAMACYEDTTGEVEEWRQRLLAYLKANRDHVETRLFEQPLSGGSRYLGMTRPEASYLTWMDCSEAIIDRQPFQKFLSRGVALTDGTAFGDAQAVRLNFATRREILDQGLDCMLDALNDDIRGNE